MQRFWDGLMRVSAAGMLAGLLLLNVLQAESAWRATVQALWLLCAAGLLVALYFSRKRRDTDELDGPDPGPGGSPAQHADSDHSDYSDH